MRGGAPRVEISIALASVFWAPGRAAHACSACSEGNETSVRRANGDLPEGDPRMRCDARPVAPIRFSLPIGRCSRRYRRSNCSGSVGVGYSTRSLTLMVLPSLGGSIVAVWCWVMTRLLLARTGRHKVFLPDASAVAPAGDHEARRLVPPDRCSLHRRPVA